MKRIDTINARENMFGVGKSGFHDNADLPGQDATYLSPDWLNTIQEELCNLLELNGVALNSQLKTQLYNLLATQVDLEALADEIENNFIRKNQIVDNLTTDDASKVASARQVRELQNNKLDKSSLNNTLTSTSTEQAATAAQVKVLNDQAFGIGQTWQNVSANRVPGTTYTNITGKTIFIYVANRVTSTATNAFMKININDKQLSFNGGGAGSSGTYKTASAFLPIPHGATYSVDAFFDFWELR